MRKKRARLVLMLASLLTAVAGCALTPPSAPQQSTGNAKSNSDEYEGWLFNSLSGRHQGNSATAAPVAPNQQAPISSQAQPNGVIQTSANFPATPGPMIPGPSTEFRSDAPSTLVTVSPETIAGPPPTIPPEILAMPSNSVSLNDVKVKPEEKKKGFELADLAPETVYSNLKKATGFGPDENIAKAALKEGIELYQQKKYAEAAQKFATAADRSPDTPLEEQALFMQGSSEFFADNYPAAHDTYGGLLKKYDNSRYLDAVCAREFAMAYYWERLYTSKPTWPTTPNVTDKSRPLFDTKGYAIQAYERVYQKDSTGPLADDAIMALANLYFRNGQFEEASYHYDLLAKYRSNSKHQMNAHLLNLQAKIRIYQGSVYEEKPLKEAQQLADQTLKQFGNRLGPEKERVQRSRAQIIEERANRDLERGKYYESRSAYGAARIYYKSVVEEFPGTQKAKEAQARMDAIRHQPDDPPGRFKWLTDAFEPK